MIRIIRRKSHRQPSRRHLSAGDGVNQLAFAALRVFALADPDIDADVAFAYFREFFDCLRFVFVNGNDGVLDSERFIDDFGADDDLFRLFKH